MNFIELIYLPTTHCNLDCIDCNMSKESNNKTALPALRYGINQLIKNNIFPYKFLLAGGEITTLGKDEIEELLEYLVSYLDSHKNNLPIINNPIEIITNLTNIDKTFIKLIQKYNVKITGRLELPLLLNDKFRPTKTGESTSLKIKESLTNLSSYEIVNLSFFVDQENLRFVEYIANDIDTIHNLLNFYDKNRTIDIVFKSEITEFSQRYFINTLIECLIRKSHSSNDLTSLLQKKNQINIYKKILLENSGELYFCKNTYGLDDYKLGNIFFDTIPEILNSHNLKMPLNNQRRSYVSK